MPYKRGMRVRGLLAGQQLPLWSRLNEAGYPVARRTVTILYATVGLILMTTSETVKRAKARHARKAAEPAQASPVRVHCAVAGPPLHPRGPDRGTVASGRG